MSKLSFSAFVSPRLAMDEKWVVRMYKDQSGKGTWTTITVDASTRADAELKASQAGKGTAYPWVGYAKKAGTV